MTKVSVSIAQGELAEPTPPFVFTSERDFLDKVDAGLADLEAGRLQDHAEVAAAVRRIYRPAS